jgi:hypothetical protein
MNITSGIRNLTKEVSPLRLANADKGAESAERGAVGVLYVNPACGFYSCLEIYFVFSSFLLPLSYSVRNS